VSAHRSDVDVTPSSCSAVTALIRDWATERPDLDTWPYRLFATAVELERQLSSALDATFRQLGIRGGDYEVLGHLRRAGAPYERTPTDLSQLMYLTTGAMTRRLDRLEKDGYLTRGPHGSDRRSIVIRLTPRGTEITDQVVERIVPLLAEILAPARDRVPEFEETAGMILSSIEARR
jgi:DNA-binding MarR family transcriptional regulator